MDFCQMRSLIVRNQFIFPNSISTAKADISPSPLKALSLHLACGIGLASVFWGAHNFYSLTLIENPSQTLFIVWVVEALIVALCYSVFRSQSNQCYYVKAVARGLLGVPIGAVLNALGAILLGAPVGIQHLRKTVHWSLLMSVFTFVPAASVFGSSLTDWLRVFAHTNLTIPVDCMISFPAHGAIIGAWLGAWPMPLDWERTWQDWPICVTYGAVLGYTVGMVISFAFVVLCNRRQRMKGD